ncbi:HAUS augmin-like complex subunit 3 isoform X1 [Hirundo rustica]|uniref:HAUS augmin-like complex subunit 3 isoform X1 n=1 Tax=Hirundo rustica TaxID=43150 RepID=UPI001A94D776|nr:HAUS augmin-like complex subunit 3 isoform X1 [Hirundo rustica]
MTPAFSLLVLTILAMFSWRSSQALPLDTVSRAADFMATLRLIYPHADTLCEKDFEQLFDCPETSQFLEWFCSTVGQENVLSPAEVEAYEALLAAGKPILEGDALEDALQMCCQVPQLPSSIVDEGPSEEALEQQLQELKRYRDLQIWRHRKLLAWTNKLQQEQKYLEKEEKVVKQELRMAHMDLKAKIFKTRAALSQASKTAEQVSECRGNMGMGQLPTLLCQMDLAPYLEQEQQTADMLESFIQQVLPESVQAPDVWEASAQGESSLKEGLEAETQMDSYCEILEERRGAPYQECTESLWGVAPASWGILVQNSEAEPLVEGRNERDVSSMESEERDGSQEVTERRDTKKTSMPKNVRTDKDELPEDKDGFWKELGRIETAYICARREVIVTAAKVEGTRAALEWAQRTLEPFEDNQQAVEAELQNQDDVLQRQLHALHFDIMQTLTHQLQPLLKAEARRFCMPVLHKHFSLEIARLQNIARRQEEAAAWLLGQQSRLDLLELQLKRERKELEEKAAWLEKIETATKKSQTRLQEQQNYFRDARPTQKRHPHKWIGSEDLTAIRLWDMLMEKDQAKQPFRSYEAMAAKCSQLVEDKRALEAQLEAPMPQVSAMESSIEHLYHQLYNSSNQLQLSSPEISELMQQLTIVQDDLYQKLAGLLSDLKIKRRSLENPILQAERNLYVHYYCNEDRLREVVEELEKQASASSRRPLSELPYGKE